MGSLGKGIRQVSIAATIIAALWCGIVSTSSAADPRRPTKPTRSWSELLACIRDRHRQPNENRKLAIWELLSVQLPNDPEPVVTTLLSVTSERDLREVAERVILERVGAKSAPVLIRTLTDSDALPAVRCRAAALLGDLDGILDHQAGPLLEALQSALGDEHPAIRLTAGNALIRRGRSGVVTLTETLRTGNSAAMIASANSLANLASTSDPAIARLLPATEVPLVRLTRSSDRDVRYSALLALDKMLRFWDADDTDAALRRIKLLSDVSDDTDEFIRRYARSVLADISRSSSSNWLSDVALKADYPSIRTFAATALRERRVVESIPAIEQAIEVESDRETKTVLKRAHTYLSIVDRKSSGNRKLRSGMAVVLLFAVVALLTPLGREWWIRRAEDRENRLAANRQFIASTFGLELDGNSHGYLRILTALRHLDLRPDKPVHQRFVEVLKLVQERLGFHSSDLQEEFPFKTDFIRALLRIAQTPADAQNVLTAKGPLVEVEVAGHGKISVSEQDFKELPAQKKSVLSVVLLSEGLAHKLANARRSIAFFADRWKLLPKDIQSAPAHLRVPFLTTIIAGDEPHERLHQVLTDITNRFVFLSHTKFSLMSTDEKISFIIACGIQDKSLSAFDDFVQQAALKPLRMGTAESLSRFLKPTVEAEEEMLAIHANSITELLADYSIRNQVCEELMINEKDHIVAQVFDQKGAVRVQDRDVIGELMKTGPISRVMRKLADENKQRRTDIEQQAVFENARLIRRLLELSRLDERGREAFRVELESQITDQDRSMFDIGGLPARRLRELLDCAADAVSSYANAFTPDPVDED